MVEHNSYLVQYVFGQGQLPYLQSGFVEYALRSSMGGEEGERSSTASNSASANQSLSTDSSSDLNEMIDVVFSTSETSKVVKSTGHFR